MILAEYFFNHNDYKIQVLFPAKSPGIMQFIIFNPLIDHGFAYFFKYKDDELDINNEAEVEQFLINHDWFERCYNSAVEKFPNVV